jgi:hypothetical protein
MERLVAAYNESFWSWMRACTALPVVALKQAGYRKPDSNDYRVVIREVVSSVVDMPGYSTVKEVTIGAMRNPIPPSAKAVVSRSVEVYKRTDDGGYDLVTGLPSTGSI